MTGARYNKSILKFIYYYLKPPPLSAPHQGRLVRFFPRPPRGPTAADLTKQARPRYKYEMERTYNQVSYRERVLVTSSFTTDGERERERDRERGRGRRGERERPTPDPAAARSGSRAEMWGTTTTFHFRRTDGRTDRERGGRGLRNK